MSAKSMGDIGYKQGAEFLGALEKAGFTREVVQQVINSPGNRLAAVMYNAMTNTLNPDKFKLLTVFEVVVPANYNHATRLDSFKVARESEFDYYNPNLTDANFSKVTTQLEPCQKFAVKVFRVKSGVSVNLEECIAKIKSEDGVLVGAQGASIAYEQGKDKLPKSRAFVSLDEKDALWFDRAGRGLPCVTACGSGDFRFNLVRFEYGTFCLLCFCELP